MYDELLNRFLQTGEKELFKSKKYAQFESYLNNCISGTGIIGENSYLQLWDKNDLEELNDLYEINEFLDNCILIGSDGGDIGYGINAKGQFFEVPFIGMDDAEIHILADDFMSFIEYLSKQ